MYSVQINQLNKSFGSKKVLDNLILTMKINVLTAVIGNNGVGKSVFLNCSLNFMEYDSKGVRPLNDWHGQQALARLG